MNCESDAMYRLIRAKPQHSSSDSGVFSIQPSEWLFRIGNSVGCFDMLKAFISSMHPRGSAPPENPRHTYFFCVFSPAWAVQPLILSGVPRTLAVENNDAFSFLHRTTKGETHVHGWLLQR